MAYKLSTLPRRCKLHHIAIQTASFEKAFHFYTHLLGLPVIKAPFIFKNKRVLAWLDAGGILIELYSHKADVKPEPYHDYRLGADHIAFTLEDFDARITYLLENGVILLKHPFVPPTDDVTQPRVAFIQGPDGEEIELRETDVRTDDGSY